MVSPVLFDRLLHFAVSKNIFYYAKRVGFRQGKVLIGAVILHLFMDYTIPKTKHSFGEPLTFNESLKVGIKSLLESSCGGTEASSPNLLMFYVMI